ncbi:hypothetical protein [Massilia yuzhufengensis]|uniref:DUF2863 domain-containing protein n=1 Tax=Massilia yuzhufengensis TaxID=1164594 RepID=A0A1I1R416_9BURK|nr:hypothetical protein [Massilia yuzhufengensis]SFD26303.1 hypothetical protein SAMN05216204_12057 [Massilia yuzhufengensis]
MKNKRPLPRTSNNPREPDNASVAQELADLALAIAEREEEPGGLAVAVDGNEELLAAVRKLVRKKRDEALYEAIEIARYTDPDACRLLRGRIEEEAAILRLRRDDGREYEIDAFLVPLFVRSTGGLQAGDSFQDLEAFEALSTSFHPAGLESATAKVVLIQHAYDLAEIDHIAFSTLHEMLREAAASLLEKKLQPAPTIEASIRGWTGERFAPDESSMELRFLLGFSLKHLDDPFYAVPAAEEASDAWFAAREERYRAWTATVAPLVRRCLSRQPDSIEVNFLYQDLFYAAKEQGVGELAMLGILSEVARTLVAKELEADQVHAAVAPLDAGEHIVMRINLYALDGGTPWGSVDMPVDLAADLSTEMDSLCDALLSLGLEGVSVASGFSQDGHAEGAEPYQPG